MLNPMFRSKHCAYHGDCLLYAKPRLSNRRRRWRGVRAECTDEAYWDRVCAELAHRERVECADFVTLYYDHGHNASVIERLLPRPFFSVQSEEDEAEGEEDGWVLVPSCTADRGADAEATHQSEAESEAGSEVITAQHWVLYSTTKHSHQ